MKAMAFFNNKGGVGKTSLVYHLAWMYATQGVSVLAVDLDPQANLTAMFLDEDRLASLWDDNEKQTIFDVLRPLINRTGDISKPHVELLHKGLGLIPGNLALSRFEDLLSENWNKCLGAEEGAFRVETAFYRIMLSAAREMDAQLVLIDVGPNLGAINRAALLCAQQVVLPLAPDLYSIQGMKNLGPTWREWRQQWQQRLLQLPRDAGIEAPEGEMQPEGYVVMQPNASDTRHESAYPWLDRIAATYRDAVLALPEQTTPTPVQDPNRLALLKHYRSLMLLAMDAHKPMFFLKPADGAIGAHGEAVKACYDDFHHLAQVLAMSNGLDMA
jgi:chromosome partitioning protein